MKPRAVLGFWLLLAASLVVAQAPPAELAKSVDPTTRAAAFLDLLAQGDFESAARDFTATMKSVLPPAKLGETWAAIQAQLGPPKRRIAVRSQRQGPYEVVFATTEFERATMDLRVVFDAEGKIAGFFLDPPPAPDPGPAPYARKEAYQEREVAVGTGEWVLPGTLAMPAGTGPFPAVVLVHGSGPNDRDETAFANKPFRDLAWGLASRRIAVLRYEKRTRQHSGKLAGVTEFTVQQETVDDALAAVDLLRRTPDIDPRRIYVAGHSLGATLLPRIGQRDPDIAGFIALAAAARPLEDLFLEQVTYLAGRDGAVTAEEQQQIEKVRQEIARVKGLKPGDTAIVLGGPASYWLDLRGYVPPVAAKSLNQPLLILQGERDYQVTMIDFGEWKKVLAGRPKVKFKSYPALNHLFVEGQGESSPDEYAKPGHVAEAVIVDIAAWIEGLGRP